MNHEGDEPWLLGPIAWDEDPVSDLSDAKLRLSKELSGWGGIREDSYKLLQNNNLEHSADSSAATGAAIEGKSGPIDPELAQVLLAWPRLSVEARAAVMQIVQAAGH